MQGLYAYFQADDAEISRGEKEMFVAIDKINELYHYLLSLLPEIKFNAVRLIEESKAKRLPTKEDLNPNIRFISNPVFKLLESNKALTHYCTKQKLSWQNEGELTRKLFAQIRAAKEYTDYLAKDLTTFADDKNFVAEIYRNYISTSELLEQYLEDRSIFWADDFDYVNSMVLKTVESINATDNENTALLPLYKNKEEDTSFMVDLFRKTILHDDENQKIIAEKVKNWEVDRIAMMDILLMKMAVTELMYFPTVPVKVTLNEYIEISKFFSTPKSKMFINGILDKIVQEFKANGKIAKTGRGLME